MNRASSRRAFLLARLAGVGLAVFATLPAVADVREVTGTATARVVQYEGDVEIQRDFNQAIVPLTTPTPPAQAAARLDSLLTADEISAAGQVMAVLHAPNLASLGNPNDAGLDLGAFSDDDVTRWLVEGTVTETRKIVIAPAEVGGAFGLSGFVGPMGTGAFGGNFGQGNRTRVSSRVLVSGAMLINADLLDTDLSGTTVRFNFKVTLRPPNRQPIDVLTGGVALVGGPNGTIEVAERHGALTGTFLPLIELPDVLPDVPLVRAIAFRGLNIPYEYDVVLGEPFDLQLLIHAEMSTQPGGIGAAAIFGLPQDCLPAVIERVKNTDQGWKLAEMIAREVDTTGNAYEGAGQSPSPTFPPLPPICGLMGFESAGLLAAAGMCMMIGRVGRVGRRRCRR